MMIERVKVMIFIWLLQNKKNAYKAESFISVLMYYNKNTVI